MLERNWIAKWEMSLRKFNPHVEMEGGSCVKGKLSCRMRIEYVGIRPMCGEEREGGRGRGVLEWRHMVD